VIPVLLEGDPEVAVVQRLFEAAGLEMGTVYGGRGKSWLDQRLPAYNHAARHGRWFVLRDLDGDADCAPALVAKILPVQADGMCLRVAVHALESWLLADRERIADFLSVPLSRIPHDPDMIRYPKQVMVNLARQSRRRAIREDMVPAEGISAQVGPGYSARIIEFAATLWRPNVARTLSLSLAGCMTALDGWER